MDAREPWTLRAQGFSLACHELVSLDFRCGSKPDERGHRQEGPDLGVKQTLLTECLKLGPNQTCIGHGRNGES